jgi:hypothetical protein
MVVPEIADGIVFTISAEVIEQPVELSVKEIKDVPALIPLKTPKEGSMVPTALLLLDQVPVPETSLKVVAEP